MESTLIKMDKTPQNSPSIGRLAAMLVIGFGFLVLGISFLLLNKNTSYASTRDFSAVPAEVSYPAPELNLTTLQGEPVSLSSYTGSVVLLNLWATWCPPCREEMPALQTFYEKYKDDGFVLLAIDQGETMQQVLPFVQEFGLTFPVWLDAGSQAGITLNTMNLPSSYVIDREGRVRLMWIGGISKKNLEKYVSKVIKEK